MVIFLLFLLSCILTIILTKILPTLRKYIPFGMIAGLILLILKQSSSIILPEHINTLFDILLCFSFSAMALESKKINFKAVFQYNDLWFYSILQFICQWSLALIFMIIYMRFDQIPSYLSSMFPVGFAGGYGSAATAGALYARGYAELEAMDLFMFASTIGLILSILGSIVLVRLNGSQFFQDNSRHPSPKEMSAKGCLILILMSAVGMFLSYALKEFTGRYIPGFALAFILVNVFKSILTNRVQKEEIELTSYVSSELLVVFGIGLLNLSLINLYLMPIVILLVLGSLLCLFMYFVVAKRVLKSNVFERSVFTWGWSIGGIIVALSTIQSLDSEKSKQTLREYMQLYLFIAPFEIALLFISPLLVMSGNAHYLLMALIVIAIFFWQFIYKRAPITS